MPNNDITNIPAPRVPFVDISTGWITREWYRFLLNQFGLTGSGEESTSIPDILKGVESQDSSGDFAYIFNQSQLASMVSQIDLSANTIRQDLLSTPPAPQIGTIAPLNQDNVPFLGFALSPSIPSTLPPGSLYWDSSDGVQTMNLKMAGSNNTIQQIGEETYYRIQASADITDGQVVMFTGTTGVDGSFTGAPATGLTAATAFYTLGVATEDIANNEWGYVTTFGMIRDIDTVGGGEAWVNGEVLYLDTGTPGGLTKVVPSAPNPKVIVATVVYANASGSLLVHLWFGGELGQFDGNVEITAVADEDLLQYNSGSGYWNNVPLSGISVGTAVVAETVETVTDATNANRFITFVDSDNVSATAEAVYTDAGITYNPNTNLLTVTGLTVTNTATASISGNAATATAADTVKTIRNSTNTDFYLTFVDSDNGSSIAETVYTDAGVTYNPSTNVVTATGLTVTNTATASINGTAAIATNTTITNDTTTNATMFPTWVTANTGNLPQKVTSTKLTFNPSNGRLGVNGILFNGDTAAANVLDDYEEGSWTATMFDASSGGNASATTVVGYYTKIGNQVTIWIRDWNDISTVGMTGVNLIHISLPFTAAATGAACGSISTEVFAFPVGTTYLVCDVPTSGARARILATGTTIANAFVPVSAMTTGVSDIECLTMTYFV